MADSVNPAKRPAPTFRQRVSGVRAVMARTAPLILGATLGGPWPGAWSRHLERLGHDRRRLSAMPA